MIDPTNITNFNRNTYELEELILFSVAVAGKTAKIISKCTDNFITLCQHEYKSSLGYDPTPFGYIKCLSPNKNKHYLKKQLRNKIVTSKLGKHSVLSQAYSDLAYSNLDLRKCSVQDLEKIHGIGPKTSRFFVLHTRPHIRVACIDVHIKKWLQQRGYQTNNYYELEEAFIKEADILGREIAELDLEIWNKYSKKSGKKTESLC